MTASRRLQALRIEFDDPKLSKLWRAIQSSFGQLVSDMRLSERQYVSASLSTGTNTVRHPLKRLPTGWTLVDLQAAETVHRTAWDSSTLTLEASGDVDVKLEVW